MNTFINGNLAYEFVPPEEIIAGATVMMAPATISHHRIADNVYSIFRKYLEDRKCEAFSEGAGLYLSENEEEYIPDGMIVCDPDKVTDRGIIGAPDLVIEVLSRSTARFDKGHKKDIYEKYGVKEYWIISPGDLSLDQYVLEDEKFTLKDVYHLYTASMLLNMKPRERERIKREFKCTLFDDLVISIDDIFKRVVTG